MGSLARVVIDETFDAEVLRAGQPVLAEFWATWCGPCRRLAPYVEALASEYAGRLTVVTIDIDEAPVTARRYGIMSVPTVMTFRDGEATGALPGPSRAALRRLAEELS